MIQCICLLTQIKAIVPSGGVKVPHPSRPWSLSRRVAVGRAGRAGVTVLAYSTGAVDGCTYCISIFSFVQSSQATVLQVLLIY